MSKYSLKHGDKENTGLFENCSLTIKKTPLDCPEEA